MNKHEGPIGRQLMLSRYNNFHMFKYIEIYYVIVYIIMSCEG